jgi:hypothetical protein
MEPREITLNMYGDQARKYLHDTNKPYILRWVNQGTHEWNAPFNQKKDFK